MANSQTISKGKQQLNAYIGRNPDGTFKKGKTIYPGGRTTPQQRYIRKLQSALDMAIDGLGTRLGMDGASAVAVKITDALEKDCVGTLAKLTPFIPKNINVDVQVNKEAHQLTDSELEAIIAHRQAKEARKEAIEGEIVDTDVPHDVPLDTKCPT